MRGREVLRACGQGWPRRMRGRAPVGGTAARRQRRRLSAAGDGCAMTPGWCPGSRRASSPRRTAAQRCRGCWLEPSRRPLLKEIADEEVKATVQFVIPQLVPLAPLRLQHLPTLRAGERSMVVVANAEVRVTFLFVTPQLSTHMLKCKHARRSCAETATLCSRQW